MKYKKKTVTITTDYLTLDSEEITKISETQKNHIDYDMGITPSHASFDNGDIIIDEMWVFDGGRIDLSSNAQGLVRWDDGKEQYIRMLFQMEKELGLLKSLYFPYSEELEDYFKDVN